MNKALDIFIKQGNVRLLYTSEERSLIENQLRAISCIENRALFDIEANKIVLVNKLIYIGDELVIKGYVYEYKVADYGKDWREVREND